MYRKIIQILFVVTGSALLLAGCKKWDDHNALTDDGLTMNLAERIANNTDLSRFMELLRQSGYADTLETSKMFTVFAPTNAALANLLPAIENDAAALKQFVGSHISSQAYYTSDMDVMARIPMLNGKYHNLTAENVDGVAIAGKDQLAKNGVLQIISEALPALPNIQQFIASDERMPGKQKAALLSVDSLFSSRVHDAGVEAKNHTLFVLRDAAWQAEVDKLIPYSTVPGNNDSTAKVAGWLVAKDLLVDTLYSSAAAIPDTIVSKFGVRVGINKTAIAEAITTSNGVVYVLNQLDVPLHNKFPVVVIEAENYTSASHNRVANTFIRDKRDSATGGIFRDVLVYNHGVAQFNLRYRLTDIPALTYRAYWMALNDNINGMTAPFTQKIGVDSFNSPLPAYATVEMNRYAEQLAGEFTLTSYKPVFNLYLTAANSTATNSNALVCNYIRLVPVF
ncbi:fasciclin domain-containing protein [Niabella yanshanensis]|uniref:Fasciclin domain-containing protein n=1 Tax=Niabella yanshanensis TaxID=577386 RepID=A0ABZ0W5S2_9BACT|nr:fasciclin domain-containing protein [Niabella yanshanensis]WQD37857.1 fasciclin domain-containing protein [Niabella yanshanensis]